MFPNKYFYVAVLSYHEDGISIEFPDLPGCLSFSDTTQQALEDAQEVLSLHLYGMECDNDFMPQPTDITKIVLEKNQVPVIIEVFMVAFRQKMNSKFVKKTLSIPNWLNTMAEQKGVNFSKVLQAALIDYMGVSNDTHRM